MQIYIVVEEVVESVGGLEDSEAFVEINEELCLNFLKSLLFEIDDLKHFIKFFSFQHLILL